MTVLDAVRTAHEALRAVVTGRRREARQTEGTLATAYRDAMQIMDRQKAEGVPFEERVQGLAGVLKQVWPQTRDWHYLCDACDDTGLVITTCRAGARCNGISTRTDGPNQPAGKYQRFCAKDPEGAYEHSYGVPCVCEKGARFRGRPKPTAEDFTAAGKSKGLTRR